MRNLPRALSSALLAGAVLACTLQSAAAPPIDETGQAPSPGATSTPTPQKPNPTIQAHTTVDPSSMRGKLLMGYQGWFSCPGDGGSMGGYYHWIHDNSTQLDAESVRVDMWPDLSEFTDEEQCETAMHYADGRPAHVYSAAHPTTVLRHFQWMSEYGIDGVFVQRFGSQIIYPQTLEHQNIVTQNVRAGAESYGRTWAIMYDITGTDERNVSLVDTFEEDWKYLVDVLKVTESPAYLHHNGRPVLAIWGLGFDDRPGTPEEARELQEFLQNNQDPRYRVTLMGGVPYAWRTLQPNSQSDPAWGEYYCSLDIISPWTVGAYNQDAGVDAYRRVMEADMRRAEECGAELMPVVFPGHAYHNADPSRPFNQFPRRGGRLYWRQVWNAVSAGADMIYTAMFDEVDEATAMYKLAASKADVPVGLDVVTLDADGECLPSDWYLRLAGEATRMLRGEIDVTATIPIAPPERSPGCEAEAKARLRIVTTSDWTTVTVTGMQPGGVEILSQSPWASAADYDASSNVLVLSQPIEQAEAGQSVEMIVDVPLTAFSGETVSLTIGRGNIGMTTVELFSIVGGGQVEVERLEWSGLGSDGRNLKEFQLPGSLFAPAP